MPAHDAVTARNRSAGPRGSGIRSSEPAKR
jgi:hypothetical protein